MTVARSRPDHNVCVAMHGGVSEVRGQMASGGQTMGQIMWTRKLLGSNHVDTGVAGGQRGSKHVDTGVAGGQIMVTGVAGGQRGSKHVVAGVSGDQSMWTRESLRVSGGQIMLTRKWLGVRSPNHLVHRPVVI